MKVLALISIVVALVAASSTVGTEKAQASNPIYALKLLREGQRLSNQIVALSTAAQRSNDIDEMCGYYVPRIAAKVRRLSQIVRLLYVYSPSSLRPKITDLARSVRKLRSSVSSMNYLCAVYG